MLHIGSLTNLDMAHFDRLGIQTARVNSRREPGSASPSTGASPDLTVIRAPVSPDNRDILQQAKERTDPPRLTSASTRARRGLNNLFTAQYARHLNSVSLVAWSPRKKFEAAIIRAQTAEVRFVPTSPGRSTNTGSSLLGY